MRWLKTEKQIVIAGGLVLAIAAIFSKGHYHPDEHFQIFEFVAYKLGHGDINQLAWEFKYQMRPGIQPFVLYTLSLGFESFGIYNPFFIALLIRLMSAALSFYTILILIRLFKPSISEEFYTSLLFLSFFLWFGVFHHVRYSSENISGNIFIIAFALLVRQKVENGLRLWFIGLLLGFAFLVRFQTIILIGGLSLWLLFIQKIRFRQVLWLIAGFLVAFGIGVLTDYWLYGNWTFSFWNYFYQNIVLDKVSGFGIEPWWFYFKEIGVSPVPPFGLVFLFSTFIFIIYKPLSPITFIILPFIAFHILIGHKELRFLFPLLGFLPILIINSAQFIQNKWPKVLKLKSVEFTSSIFWITNGLFLLLVCFRPVYKEINMFYKIYSYHPKPTVLYINGDNPYFKILDVNFYKSDSLEIRNIKSEVNLKKVPGKITLYATVESSTLKTLNTDFQTIYYSRPAWIKFFDFNHWSSRAQFWYVVEILE